MRRRTLDLKRLFCVYSGLALWSATVAAFGAPSVFRHFVQVQGDQLTEAGRPFRFLSFNIPNLHYVEDNVVFGQTNPWRWPDRFEVTDAMESVRQQGGAVARTYVLSVARTNDAPGIPRHVLGPGKFNEDGFRALDLVLRVANQTGVRVIIPFVDNWSWWGGIAEYAGFRGKAKEAFWTDPQVIADFEETIRYVLSRTNTLTGVPYREDRAILCWETGNELQSPAAWTRQIAGFIKRLDPNHPVLDGYHTTQLREESLAMPEVDIVTTHHYPGGKESFASLIRANAVKARGRKPYIVGEFGFVGTAEMEATMEAIQQSGAAGGLVWSLRPRNRDGGFYWHSEPAGGNKYKAFHWPGFVSGADYDEIGLMSFMRRKAYEIRGLAVPKIQCPAAPHLMAITDVAAIRWQGSVGATSYRVERAPRKNGPWSTAAENIDETAAQYRPQFADTRAAPGSWFYRVRARNSAGLSAASNVAGPVRVNHGVLVDELADFSLIHERTGALEIKSRDCRQAQEDAHRLGGRLGDAVVYRLPAAIQTVRVYGFFPGDIADFRLAASTDGRAYTPIATDKHTFFGGSGDYGYWKPVLYTGQSMPPKARFLKVEFAGEAQIGRMEISFGE